MQNLSFSKKFYTFLATFLMVAAFALLTACGDGGTAPATTTTSTVTPASIQLLLSNQQMQTSSIGSTDLTAIVLDSSGQAMTGVVVTFSKGTDSTAYFTKLNPVSDASGLATATLNIGTDMTNRVISVSATAGTAVASSTVTVTGTKIAVSGNTSIAQATTSNLTIIVKDSSGVAVPGVTLAVTSQNGNPVALTPSTGISDSTGQITAAVTATNAGTGGTDTLTVTGAGTSKSQALTINSANFTITAPTIAPPATTPEILVGTPTTVSVLWKTTLGAPEIGKTVNFYTSRGTFSSVSAITDGAGVASSNLTATSTGATIITASGMTGSPATTLDVVMISNSANLIAAQANPGTVAVNASGSTSKQAVISVVVRDSALNLVKNAHVVFNQATDPSGGSLATSTATTDISGAASINYIAGTTYTGPDGVRIDAKVDAVNGGAIAPASQPSTSAYLTVAAQALYVRLASDNKVYPDTPVVGTHTKQYTALVTDAAGNPAPDGTDVRFALRPPASPINAFFKGFYTWVTPVWKQTIIQSCVGEDTNRNGTLDAGEDTNLDGSLTPNGVASVNPTATTVSGFAIAKISYAKNYANWVNMDLEARAGTVGNDPPSVVTVTLPGAASDYDKETIAPPGVDSPFGQAAGCNNIN